MLVCWNTNYLCLILFLYKFLIGEREYMDYKFLQDTRERLNDSDEIKRRNFLLVLPSSKGKRACQPFPWIPSFLLASCCFGPSWGRSVFCVTVQKPPMDWFFLNLSKFSLELVTGNILYIFSVYDAIEITILVWRGVEAQVLLRARGKSQLT